MKTGLILVAHGARNPAWAAPFEQAAASVRARQADALIALAYLEFLPPRLEEAARGLVVQGAQALKVLPLFLGGAGHVRRDLEPQLQELSAQLAIPIEVLPALGESEAFQTLLQNSCCAALDPSGKVSP